MWLMAIHAPVTQILLAVRLYAFLGSPFGICVGVLMPKYAILQLVKLSLVLFFGEPRLLVKFVLSVVPSFKGTSLLSGNSHRLISGPLQMFLPATL